MSVHFQTIAKRPRRRVRDRVDGQHDADTCVTIEAGKNDAEKRHGFMQEARLDLLENIAAFILNNDLEISSANLGFANAALSGHNERLAQKLVAREIAGKSISQQWIDRTLRLDDSLASQLRDVDTLMDAFEALMQRFANTTDNACAAAASFNDVLGQQFTDLGRVSDGGKADQLSRISQAMFERLQQIEDAMNESRAETMELCESLDRARREAELDHLTGLPNRRAFERRFIDASGVAIKRGSPLSVAFCDIDHFKQVNDTHGHEAGDRVLRAVSDILQETASSDCFIARHGGEEFALLFRDCTKEDAWCKLESLRRTLAQRRFRNRESDENFGRITFSAGIAEVGDAEEVRSALTRADEALYRAKREGRNRVMTA